MFPPLYTLIVGPIGTVQQHGNNEQAVLDMIAAGADVNEQTKPDGWTPLMVSGSTGQPIIMRHLLRNGADLWVLDTMGNGVADWTAHCVTGHDLDIVLTIPTGQAHAECLNIYRTACQPWSPSNHDLFPTSERKRATELLLIGFALSRHATTSGGEVPLGQAFFDAWLAHVMPFALPRPSPWLAARERNRRLKALALAFSDWIAFVRLRDRACQPEVTTAVLPAVADADDDMVGGEDELIPVAALAHGPAAAATTATAADTGGGGGPSASLAADLDGLPTPSVPLTLSTGTAPAADPGGLDAAVSYLVQHHVTTTSGATPAAEGLGDLGSIMGDPGSSAASPGLLMFAQAMLESQPKPTFADFAHTVPSSHPFPE
jgi:hypothetical protein